LRVSWFIHKSTSAPFDLPILHRSLNLAQRSGAWNLIRGTIHPEPPSYEPKRKRGLLDATKSSAPEFVERDGRLRFAVDAGEAFGADGGRSAES
jgi:hypothetical protein